MASGGIILNIVVTVLCTPLNDWTVNQALSVTSQPAKSLIDYKQLIRAKEAKTKTHLADNHMLEVIIIHDFSYCSWISTAFTVDPMLFRSVLEMWVITEPDSRFNIQQSAAYYCMSVPWSHLYQQVRQCKSCRSAAGNGWYRVLHLYSVCMGILP